MLKGTGEKEPTREQLYDSINMDVQMFHTPVLYYGRIDITVSQAWQIRWGRKENDGRITAPKLPFDIGLLMRDHEGKPYFEKCLDHGTLVPSLTHGGGCVEVSVTEPTNTFSAVVLQAKSPSTDPYEIERDYNKVAEVRWTLGKNIVTPATLYIDLRYSSAYDNQLNLEVRGTIETEDIIILQPWKIRCQYIEMNDENVINSDDSIKGR